MCIYTQTCKIYSFKPFSERLKMAWARQQRIVNNNLYTDVCQSSYHLKCSILKRATRRKWFRFTAQIHLPDRNKQVPFIRCQHIAQNSLLGTNLKSEYCRFCKPSPKPSDIGRLPKAKIKFERHLSIFLFTTVKVSQWPELPSANSTQEPFNGNATVLTTIC